MFNVGLATDVLFIKGVWSFSLVFGSIFEHLRKPYGNRNDSLRQQGVPAILEVVGVSRVRTSGSFATKSGRKQYRGHPKHWYVYFYDDDGKFHKKRISPVEVPYYGSLIRRRKSFICGKCGNRFRSMNSTCPRCGMSSHRLQPMSRG